jgi:hypothetical protein
VSFIAYDGHLINNQHNDESQLNTKSIEVELYRKTKDVLQVAKGNMSFEAELVAFLTDPPDEQDPQEKTDWKRSYIF